MTRISSSRLVELANELSGREREITQTVERLRLLSGKQVERLYFAETTNPSSRARLTRRILARLVERRLLDRLERRIGGVRAGAAGHVYYATPGAQRLVSYWQGNGTRRVRSRYEPTKMSGSSPRRPYWRPPCSCLAGWRSPGPRWSSLAWR